MTLRKIGIATYTNFNNYGSLLQRFAMQQVLASMGFLGESVSLSKLIPGCRRVWDVLIRRLPRMVERNKRFAQFITEKAPLRMFNSEQELAQHSEEYDAFIAGSDQIWRDRIPFYFLKFVTNRRKIAYAASGLDHLPPEEWQWAKEAIGSIDYISVREKSSVGKVDAIAQRSAEWVLDPTLLLETSFWDRLAMAPRNKGRYLFSYFIQSRRRPLPYMPQAPCTYFFETVDQLARQLGLEPVFLCGAPRGYLPYNFSDVAGSGPQEFLGLIRDAELVITDSYHATLFAIQFKKPFYSLPVAWKNDANDESRRCRDVLDRLELSNRFLPLGSPLPRSEEIPLDFTKTYSLLDRERAASRAFLARALQ